MTCWVGSSHSSHHPAKFIDLLTCESEDIFYLSRYYTIEVSHDFVGGVPSFLVTTLLSLGSMGVVELEICFFNCHVTTVSKYHVTLLVESPHPKSPPC